MLPGRLSELPPSSFARLSSLLDPHKPGKLPISLAVGDPQGAPPAFVLETIAHHAQSFGQYPPINGTADWREAAGGWLCRRFHLPEQAVDPGRHLLPLNGTREGLFLAPQILTPEKKAGGRPVVLIPNPFYQCYAAAALAAGAEAVFVPATAETGFLPDFANLTESVLKRTVAAYICSPSNPEGACADEHYWRTLFALADRYDFTLFADECYADIYFDKEPVSALETRFKQAGSFERLLTFHSLSKRSGLPGLRSGIVAGDPALMEKFRFLRNTAGPQVPLPILAASAAVWRDEEHVIANRAAYAERFAAARHILGNRTGFRMPEGGFFLWLDVGNGEEMALRLWQKEGIRVLPGAYMGRETSPGINQSNPGFRYIRIALVNDLVTISAALERVAENLGGVS